MSTKISVALVGAGSMGGALLRGWISGGVIDPALSAVFDPAPASWLTETSESAGLSLNPSTTSGKFDAVVLAVKPQNAETVLQAFQAISENGVVVSVMAGKSIAAISDALPRAREIVRAMPNLPAAIGAGATALFAPPAVGDRNRGIAAMLMSAVGETVWVDSEKAVDAVTAVSGSGPAYVFHLIEALEAAGASLGFDAATARKLAIDTVLGAAKLAAGSDEAPGVLRERVTSKGGTTEAALASMKASGFFDAIAERLVRS